MPNLNKFLLLTTICVLILGADRSIAQEAGSGQKEQGEGLVEVSEQDPSAPGTEQEAQPAAPPATQPAGSEPQQPRGIFDGLTGNPLLFIMIGGFILLYLFMGRGRRKQEAKRKEMLAGLKKGDKVTSIGGIVGTISDVREDEVTVKVDDTNNVRMKFARWAIRGVGEDAKTEQPERR